MSSSTQEQPAEGVGGDESAALKLLEESLARFRRASDLDGLRLVEAEARSLADSRNRRVRKKAERLTRAAAAAGGDLRRLGVESREERENREAREAREAQREAHYLTITLTERYLSLLHLLLNDGGSPEQSAAVLNGLSLADEGGYLSVAMPETFASSAPLLREGYERSRRLFAQASSSSKLAERQDIERALKGVAVDLMAAGAEIRGLMTDAIPLVAYAIFVGAIPGAVDVSAPAVAEKLNNLMLGVADDVSAMPHDSRRPFVGLFRLAVLLGEAQAYADHWSLGALSLS